MKRRKRPTKMRKKVKGGKNIKIKKSGYNVYNTGIFNDYLEEMYDRYDVVAKTKTQAILVTKKMNPEFSLTDFKEDKHLKVDVDINNIITLEQYNILNETKIKPKLQLLE